jgi:hypothetical protein
MVRKPIQRTAEEKRQLGDRNRALHQAAYRFIVATVQQTKEVPNLTQLAEWLKELGRQPRAGKLISSMIETGWLLPNGAGYKLRTKQSAESVLEEIDYALSERKYKVARAILDGWNEQRGKATSKTGRGRRVRGS